MALIGVVLAGVVLTGVALMGVPLMEELIELGSARPLFKGAKLKCITQLSEEALQGVTFERPQQRSEVIPEQLTVPGNYANFENSPVANYWLGVIKWEPVSGPFGVHILGQGP